MKKRTLFNLGKQAKQNRGYCTAQLINSNNLVRLFKNFSVEDQEKIKNDFYKISLQDVSEMIENGNLLITDKAKRDPLATINVFKRAAIIADNFLETYALESLTSESKLILSQAYSGYAQVLYKFKMKEVDNIKEMVAKALKLDPENQMAKELSFDMNFYDIVPEPPSNKL